MWFKTALTCFDPLSGLCRKLIQQAFWVHNSNLSRINSRAPWIFHKNVTMKLKIIVFRAYRRKKIKILDNLSWPPYIQLFVCQSLVLHAKKRKCNDLMLSWLSFALFRPNSGRNMEFLKAEIERKKRQLEKSEVVVVSFLWANPSNTGGGGLSMLPQLPTVV